MIVVLLNPKLLGERFLDPCLQRGRIFGRGAEYDITAGNNRVNVFKPERLEYFPELLAFILGFVGIMPRSKATYVVMGIPYYAAVAKRSKLR
jgi:hypothetical protein